MTEQQFLIAIIALAGLNLLLLILVLARQSGKSAAQAMESLGKDLRGGREEAAAAARDLRTDLAASQKDGFDRLFLALSQLGKVQNDKLGEFTAQLRSLTESNQAGIERIRLTIDARLKDMQEGNEKKLEQMRESERVHLEGVSKKLTELTESNEQRIGRLRESVEQQLRTLQEGNEKKLEQMRVTVDEKLQGTLEKRLGESFKLVSERLEAVQRGLGEMRNLATGVGDLKKVLTNVKARGTWGEVQLGALLEQVLTPDQFAKNVQTRTGSRDMVEFAIRLPGPDDDQASQVWLPIDAKFPQEDYLRLVEASEAGDAAAVTQAVAALVRSIQSSAKDISDKYVSPPETTDFAIMFLPTEGLYAEVLRQPGLLEKLQNEHRVVVAGPTTLAAILSSLRMGFKTLAIEQRSSEVWKILSAVKSEFGKFGDVLGKVKKQLDTARNTIDQTGVRTRAIERQLRSVEGLPPGSTKTVLTLGGTGDVDLVTGEEDDEQSDEAPLDS
jgi:DNA recombination protein RmuC